MYCLDVRMHSTADYLPDYIRTLFGYPYLYLPSHLPLLPATKSLLSAAVITAVL